MQLYRYLEKQYVESFFDTGSLMLTSFVRCRELEGARGDRREGKGNFLVAGRAGTIAGLFNTGANTHLLCTSRILAEELRIKFGVDDHFVIRRPAHFLHVVADCLTDIKTAHLGDCSYSDNGFETSSNDSFVEVPPSFEGMSEAEHIAWFESEQRRMGATMQTALGNRGIFTKRHSSYHDEAEFRFAWTLTKPATDLVLVSCPDARQYCRRR